MRTATLRTTAVAIAVLGLLDACGDTGPITTDFRLYPDRESAVGFDRAVVQGAAIPAVNRARSRAASDCIEHHAFV